MTCPRVAVVVLNHTRPAESRACLASVARNGYPALDVLIVDTGALADAAERLATEYPGAELVRLRANRGYSGNVNVGLELALRRGADWVLVLNDDVVLRDDSILRLVEVGEKDPRIGIVGPTILERGTCGTIQSAGGRLARDWSAEQLDRGREARSLPDAPRLVDWVSGCALMARGDLCREVGLLDRRFFSYWEEVEWCLRARRQGWLVAHAPQARVWHASVPGLPSELVTYYTTRNHLLALARHRAPPTAWFHFSIRLLATLISWSTRPKWHARRVDARAMGRGVRDFAMYRLGERR